MANGNAATHKNYLHPRDPLGSILRIALLFSFSINMLSGSNWTAPHSMCDRHAELLNRDHINLGVRIGTANPVLGKQFRRALDFWTSVLDLEWHEENSIACSVQLSDAPNGFVDTTVAAQAQDPQSADFQGLIAFDAALALTETEMYYYSVHEIGHLLGLGHNPSRRSVMYFKDARGPERLDATDLIALATVHKLRLTSTSRAIYLQSSVWNHVPDLQHMRERILTKGFPSGLVTMLASGKRAPHALRPAEMPGNAAPVAAIGAATAGIPRME